MTFSHANRCRHHRINGLQWVRACALTRSIYNVCLVFRIHCSNRSHCKLRWLLIHTVRIEPALHIMPRIFIDNQHGKKERIKKHKRNRTETETEKKTHNKIIIPNEIIILAARNNSNQNTDIILVNSDSNSNNNNDNSNDSGDKSSNNTTEPIKRSANYGGGVCFVRVFSVYVAFSHSCSLYSCTKWFIY